MQGLLLSRLVSKELRSGFLGFLSSQKVLFFYLLLTASLILSDRPELCLVWLGVSLGLIDELHQSTLLD